MKTNWNEQFKIRIANSDKSFAKHEVVKTLLVMKLISKNKSIKNWIRIYTEWEVLNNTKCDVYFEDVKNKSIYAFEIQKSWTKKWFKEQEKKYREWDEPMFKDSNWIPIKLNDFPDDIYGIWDKLEEYLP